MMLANEQLKTVLVTVHMALRQAIDAVTTEAVLQTLRIAHQAARGWGLEQPRIAVAGLNPHAGESGLFGDEEERIIAPAIAQARSEALPPAGLTRPIPCSCGRVTHRPSTRAPSTSWWRCITIRA
jgi:4-hydroxythreonine-4-phosphate dehydrogenase (EC 1.1.1.262)